MMKREFLFRILDQMKSGFLWFVRHTYNLLKKVPWVSTTLWVGILLFAFLAIYTGAVAGYFLYHRTEIVQKIESEKERLYGRGDFETKPLIKIYSLDGKLIGELLPERDTRVTMNQCRKMDWLKKAAVSSEDRYFYEHIGISFRGVARAMINNLASMSIREGAGSISMQLGRNLFTDRSDTLYRKIYETFLSFQLEHMLTKDEILCMYLNLVYMGEGRIGAAEASWYYFRKPPEYLSPAEASMIVGLFPSPVRYSPQNDIQNSLKKQEMVLDTLIRDGHILEARKDDMIESFIKRYEVHIDEDSSHSGTIGAYGANRDFRLHHPAPAVNQYVKEFLYENIDESIIRQGGLQVFTTVDSIRQAAALSGIRSTVESVRSSTKSKAKAKPSDLEKYISRINGVMIVMDPVNGDIRAMVGGYRVGEGGSMVSRIFSMKRQPGSALKGFLYAAAIDAGYLDVDSIVKDEKININGYSPSNWYRDYRGEMTIRRAVALSVNTVAVQTLQDYGSGNFRSLLARALGLGYFEARKRFPGTLSLALGSGELTPMELTELYAPLLNEGFVVQPRIIVEVLGPDGEPLYRDPGLQPGDRVLDDEASARAVHLLRSVIDSEEGTASWIGNRRKKDPGYLPFPVAGKSGTVQTVSAVRKKYPGMPGVHDAWFVGLVPGEVSVVWVGNDEGVPFPGSGSGTAAAAWAKYASIALPGRVKGEFPYQNYLEEKYGMDTEIPSSDTEVEEGFFNIF